MEYKPDNWVLVQFRDHYRVLGGWLDEEPPWRLDSGIVAHSEKGDYFKFFESNGSFSLCEKSSRGVNKGSEDALSRVIRSGLIKVYEGPILPHHDWWIK